LTVVDVGRRIDVAAAVVERDRLLPSVLVVSVRNGLVGRDINAKNASEFLIQNTTNLPFGYSSDNPQGKCPTKYYADISEKVSPSRIFPTTSQNRLFHQEKQAKAAHIRSHWKPLGHHKGSKA
jgi:hypothetical protein